MTTNLDREATAALLGVTPATLDALMEYILARVRQETRSFEVVFNDTLQAVLALEQEDEEQPASGDDDDGVPW